MNDLKDFLIEVLSSMQAIWDWEHDKIVDHTARVRVMLSLAR